MDSPGFLELQEAWSHLDHSAYPCPASEEGRIYSEMGMDPYNMQTDDVGCGGFHALVNSAEEGSLMGNSEEDGLMTDRPFLDFINEMLLDEAMEDRTFVQQDCISYQGITNGFYDITGEHSAPVQSSSNGGFASLLYGIISEHSPPLQSSSSSGNGSFNHIHENARLNVSLYDMTNDCSAPLQSSTPSESVNFNGKQFMPSFSNRQVSTSTSNSCSSDEPCRLESPDIVNSFYNIISSERSVFIQSPCHSDHFNAYASTSGRSNELSGLDPCDPQALNISNGWINHIFNSSPSPVTPYDNLCDGYLPSAENKDVNSRNVHVSFVKNKDLDVEADYESLYVNNEDKHRYDGGKKNDGLVENSQSYAQSNKSSNGRASDRPHNRHATANGSKGASVEGLSGKQRGKRNAKSESCVSLDLKELLVSCAQAVAVGDGRRANDMLLQLQKSGASPNGSGLHRTLHYFCRALEARMHGTGNQLCSNAASKDRPSVAELLKAFKTAFSHIPHIKIAHYFANQSILKAAEGATRLHIIDYGIFYGLQWPCLINALADRKGGPPKLTITGIEFPQPGPNPAEGLEDIGRRLAEYAKTYRVPFEYHAIATSQWEDVNPVTTGPRYGQQVLVVNCMNRLQHVLDECVNASSSSTNSHRQKLLDAMYDLKPDLFVVAVINANHNSPFFVSRFRDALNYYCSKFDMLDTTWDDGPERMIVERDCMYRDILNVVACEGLERVERPENYKQWQARIQRAGFEQVPIMPSVLSRSKSHVQEYYHKEFTVDHDNNRWMLLSWKGRPTEAMSAWKPRATK